MVESVIRPQLSRESELARDYSTASTTAIIAWSSWYRM
jgi:hypothetical protein